MTDTKQKLKDYCIAMGDDALMLGQRLSEWCRNGPFLEEDLALSNVALDFFGRAQMFYNYAVELEGNQRTADDIAFLRDSREYQNLLILELPIGDFADTMARQLIVDIFNMEYLAELLKSTDSQLAAIAGKAIKESNYHLRRSHDWVLRLGDGTEESHQRIQQSFDKVWGYTHELFFMTEGETDLATEGVVPDRRALQDVWDEKINAILDEATLQRPADDWEVSGGRDGMHTEYLGHLLSDLQFLQRTYPGLEW